MNRYEKGRKAAFKECADVFDKAMKVHGNNIAALYDVQRLILKETATEEEKKNQEIPFG